MDLTLAAIEPNAFHVIGGIFAIWAVLLGVMGFSRPDFPSSMGGQRVVVVVSLALMVSAVTAAILTGETKKPEAGHEGGQGKAAEPHN